MEKKIVKILLCIVLVFSSISMSSAKGYEDRKIVDHKYENYTNQYKSNTYDGPSVLGAGTHDGKDEELTKKDISKLLETEELENDLNQELDRKIVDYKYENYTNQYKSNTYDAASVLGAGTHDGKDEELTKKDISKLLETEELENDLNQELGGDISTHAWSDWHYVPKDYSIYTQIKSNYCGPACTQSVLAYHNGRAPRQTAIASALDTDYYGVTYLRDIINYLNDNQSENNYVPRYGSNKRNMSTCLYRGIVNWKSPPIIGFACSTDTGWDYNSSGHFCVVFAAREDRESFRLGDPYIDFLGKNNSFYNVSASRLYDAYDSVNIGLTY